MTKTTPPTSAKLTILGCGSSPGVPRIGNDWGACDPGNPKNRRRRASVLFEQMGPQGKTTVLVDSSPDMRQQLLDADVKRLDGVLYTHDHADHTHGIDDLRVLFYAHKRRVDVHADASTMSFLRRRFDYCFEAPPGSNYPAIVKGHLIEPYAPVIIDGAGGRMSFLPFEQLHGEIRSLGFRFRNVAYSSDLHDVPEASVACLQGLDVWIVDALRYLPHPSHFGLEQALAWIERLKPKRAILTHMHIDLDYEELRRQLPAHVEPAYDGMVIEV